MIESGLQLGVVTFRGHRGALPFASLRPLAVSSEDRGSWQLELASEEHCRALFPNTGKVSWLHPHDSAVRGTLWEYRVAEQPTYRPDDERRDKYMVAEGSAQRTYEVLDLAGSEEEARKSLTDAGVELPGSGSEERWIRIGNDLWMLGMLVPKEGRENQRVLLLDDSGITRWMEWEFVHVSTINADRERSLLPPGMHPEGAPHQRDWSSDVMILKRVMHRLRKYDKEFTDALSLSDKVIDRFAELLLERVDVNDPDLEKQRIERAREFLTRLRDDVHNREAIMTLVHESPISDEITSKSKDILEEERSAARERAAKELESQKERMIAVDAEIAERKRELREIEQRIAARRAEHEGQINRFEEKLVAKTREVMERPEELLSNVALIGAVMGGKRKPRTDESEPIEVKVIAHDDAAATEIGSNEELLVAIEKMLVLSDAPRGLARPIHASFLAQAVPIVAGSRAYDVLSAYSHCVTGGQVCWIPVSPSWVDPTDYLGGIDTHSGAFVPHPSGLAETLEAAGKDKRMRLIVFDGIERSAVESYLLPLLACYVDSGKQSPRSYPVMMANGKGVMSASRIAWPRNVLVAAISAVDSASLALSDATWDYATLLLSDAVPAGVELEVFADQHPLQRLLMRDQSPSHYVVLETWKRWQAESQSRSVEGMAKVLREHEQKSGLTSRAGRDLALRVFGGARSLADEAKAVADAVALCLIPRISDRRNNVAALLGEFETIYEDGERLGEALSAFGGLTGGR